MKKEEILIIHTKILEFYRTTLLAIINESYSKQNCDYDIKSGGKFSDTLVTSTDIEINNALTQFLPTLINNSSVVSEESKNFQIQEYTFVIDPIDGTHTFAKNLDDWGISIALCEENVVIYSIIFYPNCKTEYYYAIKDQGSFDNQDNCVKSTPCFTFKPTIVCAPFSRSIGRKIIDYTKDKMLTFRTHGSCVYALYTVMRGGTDILVCDRLNIWDIIACEFIASQASLVCEWEQGNRNLINNPTIRDEKFILKIYKPDVPRELLNDIDKMIEEEIRDK